MKFKNSLICVLLIICYKIHAELKNIKPIYLNVICTSVRKYVNICLSYIFCQAPFPLHLYIPCNIAFSVCKGYLGTQTFVMSVIYCLNQHIGAIFLYKNAIQICISRRWTKIWKLFLILYVLSDIFTNIRWIILDFGSRKSMFAFDTLVTKAVKLWITS